jgi:hypothetical protein
MLHEQEQTICLYVLLVNTQCPHLRNFCESGVSSGLETRVTLTPVSR